MIVELGGVEFQDSGRGWVFADLVDWYSLPDSKAENVPMPQGHGSFNPGVDWRSSATPSFTAGYIGSTNAECIAAVEHFTAIASLPSPVMRVTDDVRVTSRQVSVKHIGVPDFFGYDQFEVHFAVDVMAWDPIRYGDPVTTTTGLPTAGGGLAYPLAYPLSYGTLGDLARVSITNSGTAATWPQFEVTGELDSGFELLCVETGQRIRFERAIPAGSSVVLNSRYQTAVIDGVSDASTSLTRRDWFPINPGETLTVQFLPVGAGSGAQLLATSQGGWW